MGGGHAPLRNGGGVTLPSAMGGDLFRKRRHSCAPPGGPWEGPTMAIRVVSEAAWKNLQQAFGVVPLPTAGARVVPSFQCDPSSTW